MKDTSATKHGSSVLKIFSNASWITPTWKFQQMNNLLCFPITFATFLCCMWILNSADCCLPGSHKNKLWQGKNRFLFSCILACRIQSHFRALSLPTNSLWAFIQKRLSALHHLKAKTNKAGSSKLSRTLKLLNLTGLALTTGTQAFLKGDALKVRSWTR